jgi:4'-phosphopantetheinyl transferase
VSHVVQIWRIDLASDSRLLSGFRHHLTKEEQERADRRISGRVRAEFVIGRACLRILLANTLGVVPAEAPLTESLYGKPQLLVSGPSFNVSHSHGTILIAISQTGALGVDVEHVDLEKDVTELIPSVCTAQEAEWLKSAQTSEARQRLFYRCWSRKEAVIKAEGRGLSIPVTNLEVLPTNPAESLPVELYVDGGETPSKSYFLSDIPLGSDMMGAVATDSPNCRTQLFNFPLSALESDPVKN